MLDELTAAGVLTLGAHGTLDLVQPRFDLQLALHAPAMQPVYWAMSALVASSMQLTGPLVKKNPNMPTKSVHLTQWRAPLSQASSCYGKQCRYKMHAAAIHHVVGYSCES